MLPSDDRAKPLSLLDLAPSATSAEVNAPSALTPGAGIKAPGHDSPAGENKYAAGKVGTRLAGFVKDAAIQGTLVSCFILLVHLNRSVYGKQWRAANPTRTRILAYLSEQRRDRVKHRAQTNAWQKTEHGRHKQKAWRRSPKGLLLRKAQSRTPNQLCRNILSRVLRATDQKKIWRTEVMLGYTFAEFRAHIEPMFRDGMSWCNFGDVWELDHIREVARFIDDGVSDPKIVNALSNLQPLLIQDHKRKTAVFLSGRLRVA